MTATSGSTWPAVDRTARDRVGHEHVGDAVPSDEQPGQALGEHHMVIDDQYSHCSAPFDRINIAVLNRVQDDMPKKRSSVPRLCQLSRQQ